jgi:hypothetical protein
MRLLILSVIFVIGMSGPAPAQTEPKPYKFAEFGPMSQAGVKTKMDGFLELVKDRFAQGFIIIYGTPKAIAARKKQITHSMTFLYQDPPRITIVEGGFEKTIRTVMWIVPAGATPPKP